MARSISDTFKALKEPRMLFMFLMGAASGLPFALTLGTLQAWMTDSQIDLKTIGLFAFLRLPFSVKFLWAPLMDRFTPPFLDRRRGWAFVTQALIVLCIAGIAMTDPMSQIQQLLIITLFLNFFAASQDIVLDAYRREVLKEEELALGVGVFVNGYIIAFRYISGALALLLPTFIGWNNVYFVMAGFMALLMIATWFAPKTDAQHLAPRNLKDAFVGPIKDYFMRPEALTILAFIVLYKLGDTMGGTMTLPFILKEGYSREEYVAIVKVWGPIATIAGGIVGGHYALKFGLMRSLWMMGILQALSTAAFALIHIFDKSLWILTGVVSFENLTAQMGTAAYAAYMASVTNVKFSATQYALLSSLMAVPGVLFASRTGALAEQLGWNQFFVFCGLAAIPGMFLIPLLSHKNDHGWRKTLRLGIVGLTVLAAAYALVTSTLDILKMFI